MADSGIGYWIPTHTMPWRHHPLRLNRLSSSRETRPTIWATKLPEKPHKPGPRQKPPTTKPDPTQISTQDAQCTRGTKQTAPLLSESPVLTPRPTTHPPFRRTSHFPAEPTRVLMVKNSLHFILGSSSEIIQDTQIMMSFDVEWLFATVPVKDPVPALPTKPGSDHETKPLRPHDADIFTNCPPPGFTFKISAVYVQEIQLQTTRWYTNRDPCACSNS